MQGEVQSLGARTPTPPDEAARQANAGGRRRLERARSRLPRRPVRRPFEERHDGFSVSAVLEGSFTYRSDAGHGLLYPGALLLGNNGRCFECGHPHGIGDRCISLNVREDQFGEIAAAAASTSRFRFSAPSLPPSPKALPVVAHHGGFVLAPSSLRCEELALRLIERVIALHGRRSTHSGRADRARDETGGRSDPAGRIRRGAAA